MHGLCFNINPDLNYFKHIIPCGIRDKGVTSLTEIKEQEIDINEVKIKLIQNFEKSFDAEIIYDI